ncbi:MAG: hypothetical protein ACI8RN_001251 [Glaciecola sp.]|jgi:hypothetical protein|uniref:hypothetical protein n=1 Tax=Congregibacter sp. TaxID=2744308 RepID=UPI0039E6BC95
MRKLLLHIGRHKTGTTSIQSFLQQNRADLLARYCYFIPQSGRIKDGHAALAHPLQPRNADARKDIEDPRLIQTFVELKEELVPQNLNSTVVISSEGFQNCKPGLVREAFSDYDVRVVVYLRNQLDYLASSYAQRVQATSYTGTLQDFYDDVYLKGSNYARFLQGWNDEFPNEFLVRRYSSHDIVNDFLEHALKLPGGALTVSAGRRNPSLNSVITQFKLELNRRQPKEAPPQLLIYPLLPKLNEQFPDPKLTLPREIARHLVEQCRDSDNAVAATYFGGAPLFDYTDYACGDAVRMDDALFNDIYEALIALAKTTEAETS